jgi:hypothetical protein
MIRAESHGSVIESRAIARESVTKLAWEARDPRKIGREEP